jgi:Holliday junction resolvase RusA-like endonuclease
MSVTSSELIVPTFQCSASIFSGRMPLPPGTNHQYQIVTMEGGKHRLADSKEYRQFKKEAGHELLLAYCDLPVIEAIRNSKKERVLLVVTIRFFVKDWRRDVDGCVKAVMDQAFECMELNDNSVVRLSATKEIDKRDPHAEIDVCCLLSSVQSK